MCYFGFILSDIHLLFDRLNIQLYDFDKFVEDSPGVKICLRCFDTVGLSIIKRYGL